MSPTSTASWCRCISASRPSIIGVGEAKGKVPHLTGAEFLKTFGIAPKTAEAYALTDQDFAELARDYGRMGGLDRIATLVKAIRAERGNSVLLLDGGDTWTNSWTSLKTKGQDMVDVMNLLKPDAMTGHWEFTLGAERVKEIADKLPFPFLAQNIRDTEFEDRVFAPHKIFEAGGVKVAVIGQAFPFTPIANPRWMMPKWTFGIRDQDLQKEVDEVRGKGADLVVLLSHNGFDVDRKLAGIGQGPRRHPVRPHPRRRARGHQGRQDAARLFGLARQVRLAPRPRRAGQGDQGLQLSPDPGVLGRDRAGRRGGRR